MTAPEHRCPICAKPAPLVPENPARPFCSARCKWVDLGRWLDGSYRVPDEDEAALADVFRAESDGPDPDHD